MPQMPPYGEFIFGHEYAGDIVAVGRTVDEFQIGDRVVVEAHMGCRRCENCIRGLYTACLNYGNRKRGHRANGFTTNGGLAEYAVNHVNTLYRIPDGVSYEEATVVMTSGSPLFGLENAGVAYMRTNRPQDALAPLERAQRINPNDPIANYNLGLANLALDKYETAIYYLSQSLRIRPNYPDALVQRGFAYQKLGKADSASADYERILSQSEGAISDKMRAEVRRLVAALPGR